MIDNLNLASQPFRNRTLPWAVAAVVSGVSIGALVFTFGAYRDARAGAERVNRDVTALAAEEKELRAKAEAVSEQLTPEQRRALEAAHLIVDRKGFSWSRLFADLESSLPAGVRVERINVRDVSRAGGRTRTELELTVVGRNPDDITNLLGAFARGGIFSGDLLTQTARTSRGEAGTEATLRVRYTPGVSRPAAPAEADGVAASGGTPDSVSRTRGENSPDAAGAQ